MVDHQDCGKADTPGEMKMPWSYDYNPTLGVIDVAYRGSTSARDLQQSTSRFIEIEHEQGINRFLVDTSDMELDATLLDVHDIPEEQYIVEGADRNGRVALILSTSTFERQAGLFYRDACQNRGWLVEAFSDRQEALDWLTSDAGI